MEVVEKLILWILILSSVSKVRSGTVTLNGPEIQTSDLRSIDGYVASGLPLFQSTHGFVLHSGNRPVIVKVKDPNKVIRDGIEQPNAGYYRDLPSVIPQGYEGIASTSFLLGNPIPPSGFFPSSGPVVQHLMYQQQQQQLQQQQQQQQQAPQFLRSNFPQQQQQQQQFQQQQQQPQLLRSSYPEQQQQQQQPQQQQPQPEQSIRVENTLSPRGQSNSVDDSELTRNPVVVQTSEFESTLPSDLRNPFYSNDSIRDQLAHVSLPAPGEQVVKQWNTNKIREGRVRDLLTGAGLI